jgi:hypothetical protein
MRRCPPGWAPDKRKQQHRFESRQTISNRDQINRKAHTMIHDVWLNIASALGLGLEPRDFTFTQIAPRAVVVFVSALVMVRLRAKRFFGKKTAFDLLVGVVLASTLSRAVNGSAAFFPTIGAGFVVIELHRLLALLAFHSHSFGLLIKGEAESSSRTAGQSKRT